MRAGDRVVWPKVSARRAMMGDLRRTEAPFGHHDEQIRVLSAPLAELGVVAAFDRLFGDVLAFEESFDAANARTTPRCR